MYICTDYFQLEIYIISDIKSIKKERIKVNYKERVVRSEWKRWRRMNKKKIVGMLKKRINQTKMHEDMTFRLNDCWSESSFCLPNWTSVVENACIRVLVVLWHLCWYLGTVQGTSLSKLITGYWMYGMGASVYFKMLKLLNSLIKGVINVHIREFDMDGIEISCAKTWTLMSFWLLPEKDKFIVCMADIIITSKSQKEFIFKCLSKFSLHCKQTYLMFKSVYMYKYMHPKDGTECISTVDKEQNAIPTK